MHNNYFYSSHFYVHCHRYSACTTKIVHTLLICIRILSSRDSETATLTVEEADSKSMSHLHSFDWSIEWPKR